MFCAVWETKVPSAASTITLFYNDCFALKSVVCIIKTYKNTLKKLRMI